MSLRANCERHAFQFPFLIVVLTLMDYQQQQQQLAYQAYVQSLQASGGGQAAYGGAQAASSTQAGQQQQPPVCPPGYQLADYIALCAARGISADVAQRAFNQQLAAALSAQQAAAAGGAYPAAYGGAAASTAYGAYGYQQQQYAYGQTAYGQGAAGSAMSHSAAVNFPPISKEWTAQQYVSYCTMRGISAADAMRHFNQQQQQQQQQRSAKQSVAEASLAAAKRHQANEAAQRAAHVASSTASSAAASSSSSSATAAAAAAHSSNTTSESSGAYPPSLKAYIGKILAEIGVSKSSDADKAKAKDIMKQLIDQHRRAGTFWSHDWALEKSFKELLQSSLSVTSSWAAIASRAPDRPRGAAALRSHVDEDVQGILDEIQPPARMITKTWMEARKGVPDVPTDKNELFAQAEAARERLAKRVAKNENKRKRKTMAKAIYGQMLEQNPAISDYDDEDRNLKRVQRQMNQHMQPNAKRSRAKQAPPQPADAPLPPRPRNETDVLASLFTTDDIEYETADGVDVSEQRRRERAARFSVDRAGASMSPRSSLQRRSTSSSLIPATSTFSELDETQLSHYTVQGTCTRLEKQYLRLTTAPNPADVRPQNILERAYAALQKRWRSTPMQDRQALYDTYMLSQLKAIRQDLTVQHIRNDFTGQVYRFHARLALQHNDLNEFNQCQTRLQELNGFALHDDDAVEFCAYRILYCALHRWRDEREPHKRCPRMIPELLNVLAHLSAEQKQLEPIAHALEVNSTLLLKNYVGFFALYKRAPFFSQNLMDYMIPAMRDYALECLLSTFKGKLSIDVLCITLGFSSPSACRSFLSEKRCVLNDTKDALLIADSKKARVQAR